MHGLLVHGRQRLIAFSVGALRHEAVVRIGMVLRGIVRMSEFVAATHLHRVARQRAACRIGRQDDDVIRQAHRFADVRWLMACLRERCFNDVVQRTRVPAWNPQAHEPAAVVDHQRLVPARRAAIGQTVRSHGFPFATRTTLSLARLNRSHGQPSSVERSPQ